MIKNFFKFNPKRAAYYQEQELPFHVEFKVANEMDRAWISKFCDGYFSAYNLPDIAALSAQGHEAWVVDLDVWCDDYFLLLQHMRHAGAEKLYFLTGDDHPVAAYELPDLKKPQEYENMLHIMHAFDWSMVVGADGQYAWLYLYGEFQILTGPADGLKKLFGGPDLKVFQREWDFSHDLFEPKRGQVIRPHILKVMEVLWEHYREIGYVKEGRPKISPSSI